MIVDAKARDSNYVRAIRARHEGMAYTEVLETFNITPNKFGNAILKRGPNSELKISSAEWKSLDTILEGDGVSKLFDMGMDFVAKQFNEVTGRNKSGYQNRYVTGTFLSDQNQQDMVYHAFILSDKRLASRNRKTIVSAIESQPSKLQNHYHEIGLDRLMRRLTNTGESDSPIAVLHLFDRKYQQITGDASIFDLNQREHLYGWGVGTSTANTFWQKPENCRRAVYHTLIKHHPRLASKDRAEVINELENLPTDRRSYLGSLGFGGLMAVSKKSGHINSPHSILRYFDEEHQIQTKQPSLYDLNQKIHLHEWNISGDAPHGYWTTKKNRVRAIYHVLTENCPDLGSKNRKKVVRSIRKLPSDLKNYFYDLELRGVMMQTPGRGKRDSPRAVLEHFNIGYREVTHDASLFDRRVMPYIKFNSKNRLAGKTQSDPK